MLSNIKQQEINNKNPLDTLPVALIIHDIKTIYYINNKASILLKQPVSEKEKKQHHALLNFINKNDHKKIKDYTILPC